MKSKMLVCKHIQKKLDAGYSQKEFAEAMGFGSANYVSMLIGNKYDKTTISLNRLPRLAEVCGLGDREVVAIALARAQDAGDNPYELNAETMRWIFKAMARVAIEHHHTAAGRALPVRRTPE